MHTHGKKLKRYNTESHKRKQKEEEKLQNLTF